VASNLLLLRRMEAHMKQISYNIDWGAFALIEFIGSKHSQIAKEYKTALDIGSGDGVHTAIMRQCGLEVFQVDKYSDSAEYKVDFIKHCFDQKFDIIFCSHVIEHQRNVGAFLDKIFDILSDDGLLLISAPKHPAENLIEGHLNCFFSTYFIQHLVHAGFDCREGKYLSCAGVENAAIVPKATNFSFSERDEVGYQWTEKHQERCFFPLKNQPLKANEPFFHNCEIFSTSKENSIQASLPMDIRDFGLEITSKRWGLTVRI